MEPKVYTQPRCWQLLQVISAPSGMIAPFVNGCLLQTPFVVGPSTMTRWVKQMVVALLWGPLIDRNVAMRGKTISLQSSFVSLMKHEQFWSTQKENMPLESISVK